MSEDRADILISRVAGGEATGHDWAELTVLGGSDPQLWQRVAEVQRDQLALAEAVNHAVAVAESVEVPFDGAAEPPGAAADRGERRGGDLVYPFLNWIGWGLAAALAVVLVSRWNVPGAGTSPAPAMNGTAMTSRPEPVQVTPVSAQEALNHFLVQGSEEGWVLEEMPKMLLQIRSDPAGGHELIYMRPIIERRKVPVLWQVGGADRSGLLRYEKPARPTRDGAM